MLTNLLSRSIALLAMVPLSEASKGNPTTTHIPPKSAVDSPTPTHPQMLRCHEGVHARKPCLSSRPLHGLRLACTSLVSDCTSTPAGTYQNSLQVSSSCYCILSHVSSHRKYSELSLHRWSYTMFNYSRHFGERKGFHSMESTLARF